MSDEEKQHVGIRSSDFNVRLNYYQDRTINQIWPSTFYILKISDHPEEIVANSKICDSIDHSRSAQDTFRFIEAF